MLGAHVPEIRALADYLDAFLSDNCLCVVGSEGKLKEQEAMFDVLDHLSGGGKREEGL